MSIKRWCDIFRKLLFRRLTGLSEYSGMIPIEIKLSDERLLRLSRNYQGFDKAYIEAILAGDKVFDFDDYEDVFVKIIKPS